MHKKAIIHLKLQQFLLKHGSMYSETVLNYIKENFWGEDYGNETTDVLMQLYSDLGVFDKSHNFYYEHVKKIKQNFDIKNNILDVASGCVPAFGNLLAKEQLKLGSGTVTLYDPSLIIRKPKYSNIKLYREEFSLKTDVSKYDLIIGILPCEVTEEIIKSACMNKKYFYVAMCGCVHLDYYGGYGMYHPMPEDYQQYVIDMANDLLKKYDNGELVIKQLDDNFIIDYPILYNKKTKS